jgi:hypothetical protein
MYWLPNNYLGMPDKDEDEGGDEVGDGDNNTKLELNQPFCFR